MENSQFMYKCLKILGCNVKLVVWVGLFCFSPGKLVQSFISFSSLTVIMAEIHHDKRLLAPRNV